MSVRSTEVKKWRKVLWEKGDTTSLQSSTCLDLTSTMQASLEREFQHWSATVAKALSGVAKRWFWGQRCVKKARSWWFQRSYWFIVRNMGILWGIEIDRRHNWEANIKWTSHIVIDQWLKQDQRENSRHVYIMVIVKEREILGKLIESLKELAGTFSKTWEGSEM